MLMATDSSKLLNAIPVIISWLNLQTPLGHEKIVRAGECPFPNLHTVKNLWALQPIGYLFLVDFCTG